MGFFDKLNGSIKSTGSKTNEASDIRAQMDKQKNLQKDIDDCKSKIGDLYWTQYQDKKVKPEGEMLELVKKIAADLEEIKACDAAIEKRKQQGAEERKAIEDDVARIEAEKAAKAEEARKAKEAEAAKRAEEAKSNEKN